MTTMDYEEEENPSRGRSNARRSSGSSKRSGGGSGAASLLSGMSTAGILDIVERLGLVDMVVDRVKGRLEEVEVDDIIDDVGDYLKRNPEVLVVSLGAITIAAGALVYLNRRSGGGATKERERTTATSSSGAGTHRSTGSKSGASRNR
jgi:hypothetical protein